MRFNMFLARAGESDKKPKANSWTRGLKGHPQQPPPPPRPKRYYSIKDPCQDI